MIDGVKIDVPNVANEWFNNRLLDFYTYTNTKTGEMLDGTLVATYRGLKFFITQSIKYPNKTYCSVRGSLHKYFNKGKHNANDFTIEDLQNVITELQQKFNIEPKTAILRNVEFGVNINTPVTATELLKNLVCYGNYPFVTLKIESITLGKVIKKQQANLKVYDKGLQYDLPTKNLLRFELAVKKMAYLNPYGIKTLSDLTNAGKIKPLGSLLVSYWEDVIYYDKKVSWKELTPFERKKLLYYATPRNWEDFDRKQRYRAKKHFKELMQKYSTSTIHTDIYSLIAQKTTALTAEICPRINHDFKAKWQTQNVHDLTVNIHGYNVDISTPQNNNIKKPENHTQKTRVCIVCKTPIPHKKKNALYCSKKCNNSNQALKRKMKRADIKKSETDQLNKLLVKLQKNNYKLLVEYKTASGEYADTLYQKEIATSYGWIRKITRVTVFTTNKNVVFTSYRAKQLITLINKLNKYNLNH